MTHTLHRCGSVENLANDFVILCLPAIGYNDTDCSSKLARFLEICIQHDPVNIGDMQVGNMYSHKTEEVIRGARSIVHAVFDTLESVTAVLKDLKKADLGMSVVISGVHKKVDQALTEAGLKHHTANFSLGIWGKTEKLPEKEVLEITTMCGHGLIPPNVVKMFIGEVKKGKMTAEAAGGHLTPNCACGIFNPGRAAELITIAAEKEECSHQEKIEA